MGYIYISKDVCLSYIFVYFWVFYWFYMNFCNFQQSRNEDIQWQNKKYISQGSVSVLHKATYRNIIKEVQELDCYSMEISIVKIATVLSLLRKTWSCDDDVHINRSGGTAVFVSDIHRAIGLYQNARTRSSQVYNRRGFVDRPRRFQDSNARRGDGAGESRGQSQRQNAAPETLT